MSLTNIYHRYSNQRWDQYSTFKFNIGNNTLSVALSMDAQCCECFEINLYDTNNNYVRPNTELTTTNETEITDMVLQNPLVIDRVELWANNGYPDYSNKYKEEFISTIDPNKHFHSNFIKVDETYNSTDLFAMHQTKYEIKIIATTGDIIKVEVFNHHNGYYPHDFSISYGYTTYAIHI